MMVKPSAQVNGAKILTGFEPKDSYQITIPWKFGGDYRVDAMIRPKSSFDLTVGNIVVRSTIRHHIWGGLDSWMVSINRLSPTGGEPEGSGTEARVDKDQPKNDIAATFHLVSVTKQGPIYRLLVDGRQLALVRYEGLPDPEGGCPLTC